MKKDSFRNNISKEENSEIDLLRTFSRITKYWGIVLLFLILAVIGAYIYLRYTTPIYTIQAKVVLNDEQQNGNNNLFEAVQGNFRNVDKITERDLANLLSKSLLTEVVSSLNLNVQWTKEGVIRSGQLINQLPIELHLTNPDTIKSAITGKVFLKGTKVLFADREYFVDSLQQSPWGFIRWKINDSNYNPEEWELTLLPLNSVANSFKARLRAVPSGFQTAVFDIILEDQLKDRGVIFIEELLKRFAEKNIEFKNRTFENTLEFIENRLVLLGAELSNVESELEKYKSNRGIVDLGAEGSLFLNQIKDVDQKLAETEIQLEVLTELEKYVSQRNVSAQAAPATLGLNDPILIGLLNQLYTAEFEYNRIKQLSGEKNPELRVLADNIAKLKNSILTSIANLRVNLKVNKDQLASDSKRFMSHLKSIPQKERGMLDISRQQQIKNNIYLFLLQKREEVALNAAGQVTNLGIIDKPEVAGQKSPLKLLTYIICLLIGLFLASIFIWWKEFSKRTVNFKDDIERETGIPVIGELIYADQINDGIVINYDARSVISEQFRELRTNLAYLMLPSHSNTLLFTSSMPGEGKSFVSVNMGASLALAGKKVVIIEFDLRKPKIAQSLKLKRGNGVSNYLIGTATLDDILQPVEGFDNYYLISSGPLPPNPVELLINGRTKELFNELKERFDFILIDSPPIGSVTDAKVLAQYASSTFYLVRYSYTPSAFLGMIREQNEKSSLPAMNIVFNGVEETNSGYGYKYGYGYGYVPQKKKSFVSRIFKKKNT